MTLPLEEKKKTMKEKEIYPHGWWGKEQRAAVENMVAGAVGCVYGDLSRGLKSRALATTKSIQNQSPNLKRLVAVLKFVNTAAPYVVIGVLTRWKKGGEHNYAAGADLAVDHDWPARRVLQCHSHV